MNDSYLRVTTLAATQHGAFNRRQALERGMTSTTRQAGSEWFTDETLRGHLRHRWISSAWERAVAVAVLSSGPSAVASHATALHLHDVGKRPKRIEVSITTSGLPTRGHTVHRSSDLIASDIILIGGIRSTTLARALVDSGIPWGAGIVARSLEEAIRRELVTVQVVAAVARKGRNGAGPMRDVLIERMALLGLAEGPMDEEFLRIMKAAGVDLPEPQVEIHRRGGRLIARVDFVYHQYKLVIELDGEAFHPDRDSFCKDRRKQNALVLEGYRVLRFTYFDLFAAPEYVVSQVVTAIAQSSR